MLGSSKNIPTKHTTTKELNYRDEFIVDENGYFKWNSNDRLENDNKGIETDLKIRRDTDANR